MNTAHTKPGVYDKITERIINLLESGTVPWRKPWQAQTGLPRNLVSKKPYRGINAFLLHAMHCESPYWLTYRQAQELGGNVRRGEKACPVLFWKQLEVEDKASGDKEKVPLLRQYYVFNLVQCDGLKDIPAPQVSAAITLDRPGKIVAAMPKPPNIKYGMTKAFYSSGADFVDLPQLGSFTSEAGYYGTLFQELVHATGHPSRLNRPTLTESQGFGSNPYCKEELIAEMGAAFLCGHAGIEDTTLENSAAYLKGWLEQLQNDRKLIVQAAAQAQKAADFILGITHEEVPAALPETATA